MSKVVENSKGFKVIEMSLSEVQKIFKSVGICDYCANVAHEYYYVAVLNCCYCPDCYEDFNKRAVHYVEDSDVERHNFDNTLERIARNKNWGIDISKNYIGDIMDFPAIKYVDPINYPIMGCPFDEDIYTKQSSPVDKTK